MNGKVWACVSAGSCIGGFVDWFVHVSIPYLQFAALVISVAAGIKAWLAAHKAKK